MHVLMFLKRRQDIFSYIYNLFKRFGIYRDVIQFEIPIERPDKCIHSEIMMVNKKEIKDIYKNMSHLEKIMNTYVIP